MHSISMRELQKISAGTIQALPHAVPIKNGSVTVGVLTPVPKKPSEALLKALAGIEEAAASRTPEEHEAIAQVLAERGIEY